MFLFLNDLYYSVQLTKQKVMYLTNVFISFISQAYNLNVQFFRNIKHCLSTLHVYIAVVPLPTSLVYSNNNKAIQMHQIRCKEQYYKTIFFLVTYHQNLQTLPYIRLTHSLVIKRTSIYVNCNPNVNVVMSLLSQ